MGRLMNQFHTAVYIKYFKNRLPANYARVLDLGCGGGKFIRYLSRINNTYQLFGLDHSPEMVQLSSRINQRAITEGRVKILQNTANNIPLKDQNIDLVTAFETIQFWPETEHCISEIRRVMKKKAAFIIINRYPAEGSKWWKIARVKNAEEYRSLLREAGFQDVEIDLQYKPGWVFVRAVKH